MQLVRDVVSDLWQFVASELGWSRRSSSMVTSSASPQLRSVATMPMLPTTTPASVTAAAPEQATAATAAAEPVVAPVEVMNGLQYVAYPETPCHLRPALVRDTIVGVFGYGTAVTVRAQREDWVHVKTAELEGWVERFALTSDPADVFPTLQVGEMYDAEHPETIKLRTYIDDEFSSRLLRAPLLNYEYVWYRAVRAGYSLAWPLVRPRSPGRWREILRTESSVVCSSVPLTGSIMEFTDEQNQGHLYYVDAVTPDETVTVTGMSATETGEFVERIFTATDLQQLKATFLCNV